MLQCVMWFFFFFSSRRRHTRYWRDWSSDVCSSDLHVPGMPPGTDPLAMSLLARAQRLARVLDLALTDAPGGAVPHRQAAARDDALRPLRHAVREAVGPAHHAVPRRLTLGSRTRRDGTLPADRKSGVV